MTVNLAKTRDYYVNLGKEDAQANKPSNNTFKGGSWQACAYDYGYMAGSREVPQAAQEAAKPAQEQPKPATKAQARKSGYSLRLKAELVRLYTRHGFIYDGGENGPRWYTKRLLRPQVVKQIARLRGLIAQAVYGRQDCRFIREQSVKESARFYNYSTANLYKQGKYGHNLLEAE